MIVGAPLPYSTKVVPRVQTSGCSCPLPSELLISSPWGLGVLKKSGGTLTAPMMQPNGTRFGGWLLNTVDNDFGHGS